MVVGAMVVAMMTRVPGRMIKVRSQELQGVRIQVMMMVTITKALLPMTNRTKVHIMLQNIIPHWRIPMMDRMGVTIVSMRTMLMMKIKLTKGSMRQGSLRRLGRDYSQRDRNC